MYESVQKWIKIDRVDQSEKVSTLMQYIKFPLMEKQFFIQTVKNEDLMKSSLQCINYLYEANEYYNCRENEKESFISPRIHPRRWIIPQLMVFGCNINTNIGEPNAEVYDFKRNKWYPLKSMLKTQPCLCRQQNQCVAVLDHKVYNVGGGDIVSG